MECIIAKINISETITCKIICVYRPPNQPINVFLEEFNELYFNVALTSNDSEIIGMGDLNIRIDTEDCNSVKFKSILTQLGLKQMVNMQTHRQGHTLDLVIMDELSDLINGVKLNYIVKSSDHAAIVVSCSAQIRPVTCTETVRKRQWSRLDLELFTNLLIEKLYLCDYQNCLRVNELIDMYGNLFTDILDHLIPFQSKKVGRKPKPWLNNNIKEKIRERRRLERAWVKSKSQSVLNRYTELREKVADAEKLARIDYYRDQFLKRDTKTTHQAFNKLVSGEVGKKPLPKNFNDKITANKFNYFFVNKVNGIVQPLVHKSKPRENLTTSSTSELLDGDVLHCSLQRFRLITREYLVNIIMKGNNKTSPLDPIPVWLLKKVLESVADLIVHIVNVSITTACFPTICKTSVITPVLKKPNLDSDDYSNYRPVSNLLYIGKVLEAVFVEQLTEYIEGNKLFSKFQSGFRKHHGVETALVRVTNDIAIALDNSQSVILALYDISAAFDSISHQILFKILESRLGINGMALEWLKNYMASRKQVVGVNGIYSDAIVGDSFGVPQGSKLGPIIFAMYLIPLYDILQNLDVAYHGYADDNQIYIITDPKVNDVSRLVTVAQIMGNWFEDHVLKLNASKTNVMIFGNPTPPKSITLVNEVVMLPRTLEI